MRDVFNYDKYLEFKKCYQEKVSRIALFRMIIFIVMIVSFIGQYYYYPVFFKVIFVISLFLFIGLVIIHDKYYKLFDYYEKYVQLVEEYIARENGDWKNFIDDGNDFLVSGNSMFRDLDVFGKNSLFQYLSICQTLGGRELLKKRLSNVELDSGELEREQQGIKEVVANPDFVIDFQVALASYGEKKVHLEENFGKLKLKMRVKWFDLGVAIVGSGLCWLFLGLGYFKVISMRYFYGMFIFNFVVSFLYAYIFREEFNSLDRLIQSYKGLSSVFEVVLKTKFNSAKLVEIQQEMQLGLKNIQELGRLDTLNSLKNNFLSNFCFNGLLGINLVLMYRFSWFMNLEIVDLKSAIVDVEELEAMISLAGIGIVKKECCLPAREKEVQLRFKGIKHPLLEENVCVSNDFNSKSGINIITGSNMGGKTTFIRTIGLNVLLMNAGTYVCADSFTACYFKVFTSMRVMDDTARGISTFYGELLRIKEMIDYVDQGKMLVLIDEIFKGTNYQDRIYGARKVMERLSNDQIIACVTTHDFELCDMSRVNNYYVREEYEGDQIIFDYKIRKGKAVSTNARYLMERLGIISK